MRNAKVNMGQVSLCQKSGQWRIRNIPGLTFLRQGPHSCTVFALKAKEVLVKYKYALVALVFLILI